MHRVCPSLHLPADCTTLLLDGVPLKAEADVSLNNAGIDNNSIFTVVAEQRVTLRCHHVFYGYHTMKQVAFKVGKSVGEP